jgi:hypothetical protein
MAKAIQKQIFGVPSLETARRIDDVDQVEAITAADYRLCARMRELETQFEAKASTPMPNDNGGAVNEGRAGDEKKD